MSDTKTPIPSRSAKLEAEFQATRLLAAAAAEKQLQRDKDRDAALALRREYLAQHVPKQFVSLEDENEALRQALYERAALHNQLKADGVPVVLPTEPHATYLINTSKSIDIGILGEADEEWKRAKQQPKKRKQRASLNMAGGKRR